MLNKKYKILAIFSYTITTILFFLNSALADNIRIGNLNLDIRIPYGYSDVTNYASKDMIELIERSGSKFLRMYAKEPPNHNSVTNYYIISIPKNIINTKILEQNYDNIVDAIYSSAVSDKEKYQKLVKDQLNNINETYATQIGQNAILSIKKIYYPFKGISIINKLTSSFNGYDNSKAYECSLILFSNTLLYIYSYSMDPSIGFNKNLELATKQTIEILNTMKDGVYTSSNSNTTNEKSLFKDVVGNALNDIFTDLTKEVLCLLFFAALFLINIIWKKIKNKQCNHKSEASKIDLEKRPAKSSIDLTKKS